MSFRKVLIRAFVTFAVLAATLVVGAAVPASASGSTCDASWGSLAKQTDLSDRSSGELTNVRSGRQDCFDRLVVDLNGSAPGYKVEYVSEVTEDGSGDPVSLRGGAFLEVIVAAPAYDGSGSPTFSPADRSEVVSVGDYQTFRQVASSGSFEGQTTLGVGVRARLPFRVFTLDGPGSGSRLVIDVAHSWSASTSVPTTNVYFSTGDASDCSQVEAFERPLTNTTAPIGATLNQLVSGPTSADSAAGASSWFSSATSGSVNSLNLNSDGLLIVDFSDFRHLVSGASTSCGSVQLLSGLNSTLFQFDAVESIRYRFNGSCDDFAAWLQTECVDFVRG